jgi:hypothetical protein
MTRTALTAEAITWLTGVLSACQVHPKVSAATIADVDASGKWQGKVVTEVTQATEFWEAEHQDCLERYPNGCTCHYVRPEWQHGLLTRAVRCGRPSSRFRGALP